MTLEALLRAAHDAGTIDTLSIFGPRKGAEKLRYRANLKRVGEPGWRVEHRLMGEWSDVALFRP